MRQSRFLFILCCAGHLLVGSAAAAESWTLAILPDTQNYAASYPATFTAQTQYLVNNKTALNLKYVLHEGDLTNSNSAAEWTNGSASMQLLDNAGINYSIAPGNHDYGSLASRTSAMSAYFPISRLAAHTATYGGAFESGSPLNTYSLFSAGGTDWLVLALEFGPRDNVLDWADSLMKANPTRQAIIVTHAYLYSDSTRYDWAAKGTSQDWNPHAYISGSTTTNDGQEMWDALKDNANLKFVFNGHVLHDGVGYLASTADNGHVVHQMLANYQDAVDVIPSNSGYMRLLEFGADGQTVHVRTYSPTLGYLTTADQDFEISLALATTYYWYGSDAVLGGAGTWDTTSTYWSSSGTGKDNKTWGNTSDYNASFGGTASTSAVTVSGAVIANGLTFASSGYTLSAGTLNLYGGGIDTSYSSGGGTVSSAVVLRAGQDWNVASGGALTVSGAISGGYAITKSGGGTLSLTNVSSGYTFSGGITLSVGCLTYGAAAGTNNVSLGSGTLTLSGGTLATLAHYQNLTNAVFVSANSLTYIRSDYDVGLYGNITGSGTLNAAKGGGSAMALYLCGANAGFGGTFVLNNSGMNIYVGSSDSGSGAARFVFAGATATTYCLQKAAGFTGDTFEMGELSGSGAISLPAVTLNVGALNTNSTFSGLIFGSTALRKVGAGTLTLSYANTYSGGTLLSAGCIVYGVASSLGTGTLTLSGGTLAANGNNLVFPNTLLVDAGKSNYITSTGSAITDMHFGGSITGSGSLTIATSVNTIWLRGSAAAFSGTFTNQAIGSALVFLGNTCTGSSIATWILNANTRTYGVVGTVSFGALSGTNPSCYLGTQGSGNTVTYAIGALNTNTTYAGRVCDGAGGTASGAQVGLVKVGTGTLTLTGANAYTGTTTVGAGALVFQGTASISAALTYTKTNVAVGTLVFDYAGTGAGDSISSQVNSILAASYNGGTNSWASGVIHSTLANANGTASYALGWSNNTTTSAVTVKVVLYGDATLDGSVNVYDLGQVLANYNQSGVWAAGDFNYDGTVNIYDLGKVLANYNSSLDLSGLAVDTSDYSGLDGEAIGALEAAGVNVVPEPDTLALLTAGVIGWLAYARRRRNRTPRGRAAAGHPIPEPF
jgi:autotransporter-associated beta strand protein